MNHWPKWETDTNSSDILTSSPSLTDFCGVFHFLSPENIRKLMFFGVFRGYKNGSIGQKWVKEIDRNNYNLLMIVNSVHVFNFLSDSPVEIELIGKKLGY